MHYYTGGFRPDACSIMVYAQKEGVNSCTIACTVIVIPIYVNKSKTQKIKKHAQLVENL